MGHLRERKNILEKIYVNTIFSGISPESEGKNFGNRRILHQLERRYLSPEAQEVAYCLLSSRSVPVDVTENAIQQAVILGSISDAAVDASTFEALFEAVTLNPSFRIPCLATTNLISSNTWLC
jgi:hypothetical protein